MSFSPRPAVDQSAEPSATIARTLLVFVVVAFVVLGLFVVPGSSLTARPSLEHQTYFLRQLLFAGVGGAAALVCRNVPARWWFRLAVPAYLLAVAGLAALLVPGVAREINGARRWFSLGPITIQWSEFARLAVVLLTARFVASSAGRWRWRRTVLCLMPGLVAAGLVVVQPDFGGGLLIAALSLLLLFLGGVPWVHLVAMAAAATVAAVAALVAEPYRLARLAHFVQTWNDLHDAPYQVKQSLLSFVSGGLWGTGLGAGWQKFGFLPEANTDYVFAVIGEELGLVGALMVLAGWLVFLWAGWSLASRGQDPFAQLVARGLVLSVTLQAAIHVGVVLALLPPKGIGLPFVSYGGSNLTASLVAVGILLAVTCPRRAAAAEVASTMVTKQRTSHVRPAA